jgi:hypothetical protein
MDSVTNSAGKLTTAWGHVVGGIAGGLFLAGGTSFFGVRVWLLTCHLDWSKPDWTQVGVLLMGPIFIGAVQLLASWVLLKKMRNHFKTTQA